MDEDILKLFFRDLLNNQEDFAQRLVALFNKTKEDQLLEFNEFLAIRKADTEKKINEIDQKYEDIKQAEQDALSVELGKIDEILNPKP